MEKKNLVDYYQNLGNKKTEFARKVAMRCGITTSAVVKWCYGDVGTKNENYLEVLSNETGIAKEDLFNRNIS